MAKKTTELANIIMDADTLSSKASHRRVKKDVEFKPEWKCDYCKKVLANETYFMRHHCKEKTRSEELATPIGQAAYLFYVDWMKLYKRRPPDQDTFATSRYYNSFVEFAKHVKKLNLASPSKFLEIMHAKDISPVLWRRDQCYSMYLDWLDKKQDPLELVKLSIETLLDITDKEDVQYLSDVFIHLGPKRIAELVRIRKVSPWFLFCSGKFSAYLRSLARDEQNEMSAIINPSYWTAKLNENPALVKEILQINKEMGL